jgi:hypothetical protein
MRIFRALGTALPLLAVTLTPLLTLTQAAPAYAISSASCTYNGESYGANASAAILGTTISKLGDEAVTSPGTGGTNTSAGVTIPSTLSVGAITDTETPSSTATHQQLQSESQVANAGTSGATLGNLLSVGNIIVINTVDANFNFAVGSVTPSVTLLSLSIAGVSESATPTANTTISVPLLGSVTLNEEVGAIGKSGADLTANGIVIQLLPAVLGGVEIELGHTYSSANCFPVSIIIADPPGPSCNFVSNDNPTGLNSSGDAVIYVSCVDTANGIDTITTTHTSNVSVSIPTFTPGTTSTIVTSFTDTNNGSAHFTLTATDNSSEHNQTVVDPGFVPFVRHYPHLHLHFLRDWLGHWF